MSCRPQNDESGILLTALALVAVTALVLTLVCWHLYSGRNKAPEVVNYSQSVPR